MIVEAINPGATLESAPVSVIIATSEEQIKHQTFNSELANKLQRGQASVSVKSLSKLSAEDLAGKICICTAELERELLGEINSADFDTLKLILQECTGLLWITEGACRDSNHPSVSLIHGLARTLRAEHEGFPLITFDFSPETPLPASQRVGLFLSVFDKALSNYELADREYSEKNGLLYIKRCIENAELNGRIAGQTQAEATSRNPEPFKQPGRPLTLEIGTPGLLDTLIFRDDPTPAKLLAPDYVEIDVQAVGLNFRDIMVCMGQLVDNFLGCECSGIVTKIGSEVTNLKVGDRVCTWTLGAYCNYVHNPAALVQQIPDDMTFTVAASLPIVYCTAYYGLVYQARIRRGETVLIHAAAGGVGQAAIMLCKFYCAEIFVTVGTKDKKEHIMETYGIPEDHIFSSRNLTFADGIKRLTGGKGVDVVLNCLSGEALKASWAAIAPFGRFIEIGKKDIEDNTRLGMAPFIRNVTFSSIDLTVIFRQRKALVAELLSDVMSLLRQGSIGEVSPIKVFPFSRTEEAFRYMQAGKHMGKIVLVPQEDDIVPVGHPEPNSIFADLKCPGCP